MNIKESTMLYKIELDYHRSHSDKFKHDHNFSINDNLFGLLAWISSNSFITSSFCQVLEEINLNCFMISFCFPSLVVKPFIVTREGFTKFCTDNKHSLSVRFNKEDISWIAPKLLINYCVANYANICSSPNYFFAVDIIYNHNVCLTRVYETNPATFDTKTKVNLAFHGTLQKPLPDLEVDISTEYYKKFTKLYFMNLNGDIISAEHIPVDNLLHPNMLTMIIREIAVNTLYMSNLFFCLRGGRLYQECEETYFYHTINEEANPTGQSKLSVCYKNEFEHSLHNMLVEKLNRTLGWNIVYGQGIGIARDLFNSRTVLVTNKEFVEVRFSNEHRSIYVNANDTKGVPLTHVCPLKAKSDEERARPVGINNIDKGKSFLDNPIIINPTNKRSPYLNSLDGFSIENERFIPVSYFSDEKEVTIQFIVTGTNDTFELEVPRHLAESMMSEPGWNQNSK
jgi:hypothetical protein